MILVIRDLPLIQPAHVKQHTLLVLHESNGDRHPH